MSLSFTVLSGQDLPDEPAPIAIGHENGDFGPSDPIAAVLHVIAPVVGGENLLAIWHEDGELPGCMAWHAGRIAKPDLATEMVAAACRFASTNSEQVNWCASSDGARGIMIMGFPVEGGAVTVTALFPNIEELTRSLEIKMSVRGWPMLGPFFRLWVLHLKSLARANGFASASDQLDVATFHFDDRGHLLFGNEAGRALIAAQNGLRRSGSSLGGASLAETIALQSAIDDAIHCEYCVESGDGQNRLVAISRVGARPLLAAAVPIGRDRAIQGGTAAILHVIDPDHELLARLTPACKLYGLSPVETKLACLLADGVTLADAGKQINVREQTARSYLKQIFAKTVTTRQAELVGLLLKSAIVTVPGPSARHSLLVPPIWGARESPDRGGRFLTGC